MHAVNYPAHKMVYPSRLNLYIIIEDTINQPHPGWQSTLKSAKGQPKKMNVNRVFSFPTAIFPNLSAFSRSYILD